MGGSFIHTRTKYRYPSLTLRLMLRLRRVMAVTVGAWHSLVALSIDVDALWLGLRLVGCRLS